MTTLLDLRYHRKIIATPGEKGKNKKMHGANGEHKVVKVPLGTIVKRSDNNQVLADLTKTTPTPSCCSWRSWRSWKLAL